MQQGSIVHLTLYIVRIIEKNEIFKQMSTITQQPSSNFQFVSLNEGDDIPGLEPLISRNQAIIKQIRPKCLECKFYIYITFSIGIKYFF